MEHGLRDCCRSMRIGKMLVMRDEGMNEAKVFYAKFPPGIHERNVLLLYPIMSMYGTVADVFLLTVALVRCYIHTFMSSSYSYIFV